MQKGDLVPLIGVALCCGGPLLLIALVAAGPAILGALGVALPVVALAALAGGLVALWVRRRDRSGAARSDILTKSR